MPQDDMLHDQTYIPSLEDSATQKIDSRSIDVHERYLEELSQKHEVEVKNALIVYLPSQSEPIIFVDQSEINVGRQDSKGRIVPELDLGRHSAAEYGVSRLHAKIAWDGEQYLIEDLHSTNHTWLNGQQLFPYHYYPITDGSTIQFGKLAVTVFIIKR